MGSECLADNSFTLVEGINIVPYGAQDLTETAFSMFSEGIVPVAIPGSYWGCGGIDGKPCGQSTIYYKMIARDPDCIGISYVSWVVLDTPDITAAQYTGSRCGSNPLVDIAVEAKWVIED